MIVQGHAVQAIISAFWGDDEAEALAASTDPASRAILTEVDHQVAGYARNIMDDLINHHKMLRLGDVINIAFIGDVSAVQFGGILNAIAPELKLTRYHELIGVFVFRKTNRIHTLLDEAAFKA